MMFAEPAVDLTRAYGSARSLRQVAFARARPARVRQRAAGRGAGRGDHDAGRRARSARSSRSPATRCCRRRTARSSTRRSRSSSSWSSVDFYLNETTRHAHLILPPASPLERSHYDIALSGFAVRNVAKFSPALFPKPAGRAARPRNPARADAAAAQAPRQSAARLQLGVKDALARRLGPDGALDWMLKTGRYGVAVRRRLTLVARRAGLRRPAQAARGTGSPTARAVAARLRAEPNGVDLGPLEQAFPRRLATRDRRLQLAPPMFVADLARARDGARRAGADAVADRPAPRAQQQLVDAQQPSAREGQAALHVADPSATTRRRAASSTARSCDVAFARRARRGAPPKSRPTSSRGVVSLPHGWGHGRPGVRLAVASAHAGRQHQRPGRRPAASTR